MLFAAALVPTAWLLFRPGVAAPEIGPPELAPEGPRHSRARRRFQAGGLIVGFAGVAALAPTKNVIAIWWWAVAVLSVAAVIVLLRDPPTFPAPDRGRHLETRLWLLACFCVVLTLVCHRPDADDAHYVNIAVSAADLPEWPLMSGDTMHGVEGLPLVQPAYRFHSFELWNGALSFLTRIPAIYCFHWVSAALGALFVPLAFARLFRMLTPRMWLWSVAVLVFVLLAVGETHRWYGNFAFVRMWQGKAVYLFVFLPLIYAYGLAFARRPSWRGWILLCAAQTAAVGCSSSAIWGATAGAAMAIVSALGPTRKSLLILGLGALTSTVVVFAGWMMKGSMRPMVERLGTSRSEPGENLGQAMTTVLGNSNLLFFGVVSILVAWACCPRGLAQRFAVTTPLAVLVVLLNPYMSGPIAAHLTGPSYWRSLWALPMPILMTLILISPLRWRDRVAMRTAARVGYLALLAAFAALVPRFGGLSDRNGVRLGVPALKVPPVEYRAASILSRSVSGRAHVVAPFNVGPWIPTLHHHAYPLRVRDYSTSRRMQHHLGSESVHYRRTMSAVVSGRIKKNGVEVFRDGLDEFDIQGVCLRQSHQAREVREILKASDFYRINRLDAYEIWIRGDSTS